MSEHQMLWKKIFKFSTLRKFLALNTSFSMLINELFREVEPRIYTEKSLKNLHKLECDAYSRLRATPAYLKPDLLVCLLDTFDQWQSKATQVRAENDCLQMHSEEKKCLILMQLQIEIAQTQLHFSPGKFRDLCNHISQIKEQWRAAELLGHVVNSVSNMAKRGALSDIQAKEVEDVLRPVQPASFFADTWVEEAPRRGILVPTNVNLSITLGNDQISLMLKNFLHAQNEDDERQWRRFLKHCCSIQPSTQPDFWLREATRIIEWIGADVFKKASAGWIRALSKFDLWEDWRSNTEDPTELFYVHMGYVESNLARIVIGVCWTQATIKNSNLNADLTKLARECIQPKSCFGNCASSIGDAAIYALAHLDTRQSLLSLASLKSFAHRSETRELIDTYLQSSARKMGLIASKLEDRVVPDFGLIDGKRIEVFSDCQLVITCSDTGYVKTQWKGREGKTHHNPPLFVEEDPTLSRKLYNTHDLVKQVKRAFKVQQRRIGHLIQTDMNWSLDELEKFYINHGLISTLTRNLIWVINGKPVLWISGQWQQVDGQSIVVSGQDQVKAWKPEDWSFKETLEWQKRLDYLERPQAIRQLVQKSELH
ncbi:DUF4132 domain-containing protein [Pseudovibrio denitrificans]|uniref:DUF4132 domain-containing protein n=1 Tax=Pseudovibrio denitrificans TaxID=258256 RepID=UPI0039BFA2EC